MKFRDLIKGIKGSKTFVPKKREPRGQLNLLTGKPVKRTPKVAKEPLKGTVVTVIDLTPVIDNKGVIGDITHYPNDLQKMISNLAITRVQEIANGKLYHIKDHKSLKVVEVLVSTHKKYRITLKDKKKLIIHTLIPRK